MSREMRVKMALDGPEVSRFSYGVWRFLDDAEGAGKERVRAKIDACLEVGITTFDHADIYGGYGCERAFGAAMAADPGLRDQIEIVTKCGIMLVDPARPDNRIKHYDYTREHIVASVERSLTNLHVEVIDVLLLHRPSPLLDPDEVAAAVDQLRSAGKLKHIGVSNFTRFELDALASRLDVPIVTNQVEMHPLQLEPFLDGTLDQCIERRIAPMAWSPTGGGRLFSDDFSDHTADGRVRKVLAELAGKYGVPRDQVIYAWLLAHPAGIQPVLGTSQPERIASAAKALDLELDIQDWFAVWSASSGGEVP